MKNSETFDRAVEVINACGKKREMSLYREGFLREAGLALAASRKDNITAKGGKIVETFSARKVGEKAGMPAATAALFAGAWAYAHGEQLSAKLLEEAKA